jgi:hypothetical protein
VHGTKLQIPEKMKNCINSLQQKNNFFIEKLNSIEVKKKIYFGKKNFFPSGIKEGLMKKLWKLTRNFKNYK